MAHHWRVDAWWNHDGAAGDLLGAVLYGALGLELTDMRITKDYTRKDGVRTVTVQLAAGERLMAFEEDSYYQLGGQIDDVVAVHCIIEGKRVYWCSIEQKWVEA